MYLMTGGREQPMIADDDERDPDGGVKQHAPDRWRHTERAQGELLLIATRKRPLRNDKRDSLSENGNRNQ